MSNSDASKRAETSSTSSESQIADSIKRDLIDYNPPQPLIPPASSSPYGLESEKLSLPPCVVLSDIAKPLTIQTLFEKTATPSSPFSNYSTDSASEVGSAFNSPMRSLNHSRANSPNSAKVTKFQQWKASSYTEERRTLEEIIDVIEKDKERIQRLEDEEANLELRRRRLDSGGKELRSGLVTSPTSKVKHAQAKKQEEGTSMTSKSLESAADLDGASPFTPRVS